MAGTLTQFKFANDLYNSTLVAPATPNRKIETKSRNCTIDDTIPLYSEPKVLNIILGSMKLHIRTTI